MKFFRIVALYVGILLMISGGATCAADSCQPTFLQLGEEPVEVEVAHWELKANGILIGCKSELKSMTEDQILVVRAVIGQVLEETHFGFLQLAKKESWRRSLCGRINQELGGELISDIYFDTISYVEYEAKPPELSPGQDDSGD